MDIDIDVDTAVAVPVNIFPLIDDTDFKSREVSIVYNQAGMDLVWNFVTSAGVMAQTAVTPTTAGVYDWTHVGDGMYKIEIPASGGGSINNDAEGYGWFTGICTGVLPWRSPVYRFRAAALNDALCDGGDVLDVNTTQWLGTAAATPTTAGVPEVDVTFLGGAAQSLTDLKDFADAGYDPATNKVQGVVLVDTTTTNTDMLTAAAVNAEVDTALSDYDAPTNAEMTSAFTEIKGATWSSSTDTLEALRDWIGDGTNLTEAGGDGDHLSAIPGSSDPWSTALPGAYGAGTAGFILGTNLDAVLTARTLATADYFDPAADTVANVTTVATNTDMRGTDNALLAASITVDGSGHVTLADGAHGGTSAVLTLERAVIASTTLNEPGFKATGNGTAAGMALYGGGGAGDAGLYAEGATYGLHAKATGTNTGKGILAEGEGTGAEFEGLATNGDGLTLSGRGSGHALFASALGSGDGICAQSVSGDDISGDLSGTLAVCTLVTTTTTNTDMRGTDGANTTVPDAAGTAATLHSATDGLIATTDTVVDAIKLVTDLLPDSGALSSLATAAALSTAQTDLDTITGTDGVTLATAQANYAPATAAAVAALNDIAATDIVSGGAITTSGGAVSTVTTNTDMRGTDNAALATSLATAQTDLDTLTGTDGATLATSQPNYAPNTVVPDAAGTAAALTVAERNSVADALLDRVDGVETAHTVRQALRLSSSVLGGKVSGMELNAPAFRDINDTVDRLVGVTDANGNRTTSTPNL